MMKIAILGYSGSGKSTLAQKLADHHKIPVLFLDSVHFLQGWAERENEEGRRIVSDFMQNESWVIDGNYRNYLQQERLQQADLIILMMFPRFLCLTRVLKRYLKYKNTTRGSMAEGCNEKLDREFVWWVLHKGRREEVRRRYKQIADHYREKTITFTNQQEVNTYLEGIRQPQAAHTS